MAAGVALFVVGRLTQVSSSEGIAAVAAMAGVVWALALVSLLPLRMLTLPIREPQYVIAACLAGTTLRMLASLLAAAAAVALFDMAAQPVAVSLLVVYLPVLGVEVAMVAGFIRGANHPFAVARRTQAMEVSA